MKKGEQNRMLYLDELDLMLIEAIKRDARISYQTLASKVGTSPQTANRRINKLIDNGIIKIVAVPDYTVLGYNTILFLAINAPPGMLDTLTEQLSNINSIKHLHITTGRYHILAVAVYRSIDEYLRLFPTDMVGIPENIRIEIMSAIKVVKNLWSQPAEGDANASHSNFIPTDLDLSVMRELFDSPRAPVTEIAHNIGANVTSVNNSLRRLTSQGIIKVISVTTSAAFGYNISGITLIQIHPSRLEILIDQLNASPFVYQMILTLGAFNCVIWTTFENSNQMRQFLIRDLGSIPGVLHYENLIVMRTKKLQPIA